MMQQREPHRAQQAGVGIAGAASKHKELVRGSAACCWLGPGQELRAGDGVQEGRLPRCSGIEAEQAQRGLRDRCEDGFRNGAGGEPGKAGTDEPSS